MDERAYEEVGGAAGSRLLLICDHATNRVPASVAGGDLGLPAAEMARHIAYDMGARGVALELARITGAPALLTRFSRLVIDPNRGEDDPTLVMRLYDGTIIPANRHVTRDEVERRL
ncbi:MAG TPA: N-formylglutamate amidohydrolase, partial [Amaricoccus sp.]|nr:N-formylglutamate amidohydrolase [Amaricoccus sp.]